MRLAPAPLASLPTLTLLAALLGGEARALGSQQPVRGTGGVVTGTVRDSTAARPLGGALVQLVSLAPDRAVVGSAASAPDGAFMMANLPAGRFMLGFLHPRLDSLGIDLPARTVVVVPGDTVRVDLAVPSDPALQAGACGDGEAGASSALTGVVRDATTRSPLGGVVVQSAWMEFIVRRGEVSRRRAGAEDTTTANGAFALCGVPRGGALALRARRGSDTTAIIEIEVPATGRLRRDLFLALGGEGRLHGRVVSEEGSRGLAGVVVAIEHGPETRTSAEGEWNLNGVPMGTRVLEVRGLGYYPRRIAVDVVPDAPAVQVSLPKFLAVLDTIRVTAAANRLKGTGFEERRRSAAGKFITAADMLRFPVISTSDVFVRIPGMQVDRTMLGDTRVTMRGPFGRCVPMMYVNGSPIRNLAGEDIDAFVSADEVAGIEVYSGGYVPPQFQEGLSGCGSIVIWTKPGENPARRWSARRRALHGAAAMLLGAGIGVLFAHH